MLRYLGNLFIVCACLFKLYNAEILDSKRYLDQKFKYLQESVTDLSHLLHKRDLNTVMVKNLEETTLPELTDVIKMLSLSKNTNSYTKSGIYEILKKIYQIKNITFAKNIKFNNDHLIIIKPGLTEDSYIYQYTNGTYNWVQTIWTPDAIDSHFFINNNNLYLVMANNKGDGLAVTSIYKWLGFHFDEIQTVFTTGAIKVGSFTTRNAEIIIILQDIPNVVLPSAVFEFSEDKIEKIQRLNTFHGINLNTYSYKNKNYVIIFTRSKNNVIYGWNGFQVMELNKFETQSVVYNSKIFKVNENSFLEIAFTNKLMVYYLTYENIKLESEIKYKSNLTTVYFQLVTNGTSYVIGVNEKNTIKMITVSLIFNLVNTESNLLKRDILSEYFNDLEIKIRTVNKKINETKNKLIEESKMDAEVILAESLVQESAIENRIQEFKNRFNRINSIMNKYIIPNNNNNLIINGEVTFKKEVNTGKLTGSHINIKLINDRKWTPEQWLRYQKPQTISGPSKIKTVIANSVKTSSTDPIFKDVLLNNKNQIINGSVSIYSLNVSKLYAKNINGISMDEVYFKSQPEQIKGIKTFKFLDVNNARMAAINENMPEVIISSVLSALPNLDLESNITVENLEVDRINGIPWNEFKNSVFRINFTKEIIGPITFSKMNVKHFNIKKIKDISVEDILTTSSDQIIESNMKFKRIFTNKLQADNINGIKIPQDVVFVDQNTTIQGPVKFDKIKVTKDLTLSAKLDQKMFLKDKDHIVGTKESDLSQIYSGKVTIKGNLHLSNLKLLPNSKLFISKTEVNPNFTDIYWTKNTQQKIPVDVIFLQSIKAPHVLTKVLNNVKFDQYLLDDNADKLETDFEFENVTVLGNLILRENQQHKPDLNKVLKEGVRTTGNYIIHGKKTYLNTLKAENLQTTRLEGIYIANAVNKIWPKNFTGTKTIKHLIVKNNLVTNVNKVKTINGVSLEKFIQKVVFIDKPVNITNLDFENIKVLNLHIKDLNGENKENYLLFKENLKNTTLIKNLILKGNVDIEHIRNMAFLNNISYSDLLKNTPRLGKYGILEDIVFTGKLTVKDFIVDNVNNISLRSLTKNALNLNFAQVITAPYTIFNLKADNIFTKKINNVSVENMIDTSSILQQKLFSQNATISLLSNTRIKKLKATKIIPCGLDTINREFADPPSQKWSEIIIKGNVTLLDEDCLLYRIFEKSVKLKSKNIIHSNVKMLSHVTVKNLRTNNLINNIDIPHLLEDSVLVRSNKEQKITGKKWFVNLDTNKAHVMGNTNTQFINRENVTALNSDIVDKDGDKVIRGKKTFYRGLQTDRFNSEFVSGVKPDNLVNLYKPKIISEAIIDTFEVKGDLNIKFYNETSFTNFIDKRLIIDGNTTQVTTGVYYFDYLEAQNFTTPKINDIKIEDIVFDVGTQDISGIKHFKQHVDILGNINVDYINGQNITREFITSIPLKGLVEINGSITILKPININGSITTESINNFPIALIKEIVSSNNTEIETEEIYYLKKQIIKRIDKNLPIAQNLPTNFMYLELSNSLQIKVPNTISASTITSNSHVLIHVNGQDSGAFCGLPNDCSCPVQYSIEVSPQNSLTELPNKGFQRIFTYDDDSVIVNFMTNSVSTTTACRTNHSKVFNEKSMITWNTKTQNNTVGLFYHYDEFLSGYISKVDFFNSDGKTYAVIGRYYDSVLDTYDLDCTVLRFDNNKTSAMKIQVIPTKGVQEVYLLPTAQGVVLVLGNKIPSDLNHEQEQTQIFRFSPAKEKFVQLRTVPSFGCSTAAGVVYGTDSLIALGHREAPVQVLKYYPEFDNYYYFQTFDLDKPVIAVSSFYTDGFGISDAYLCLITSQDDYYVYTYRFLEGFILKSKGKLKGLRNFVPFELNTQKYLFAPSSKYSSLLTVVKNGST